MQRAERDGGGAYLVRDVAEHGLDVEQDGGDVLQQLRLAQRRQLDGRKAAVLLCRSVDGGQRDLRVRVALTLVVRVAGRIAVSDVGLDGIVQDGAHARVGQPPQRRHNLRRVLTGAKVAEEGGFQQPRRPFVA